MNSSESVWNVLITGALHKSCLDAFQSYQKFKVTYLPDSNFEKLLPYLATVQALVTRSELDVDAKIIDASPQLKLIARAAVGVGNIDIDHATRKGILVVNCPGKNTNSAAELTFGLILNLMRKIPEAQAKVKSGGWDRHRFAGNELRGKTLGIVGLGNVGHRVARFGQAFEMNVLAYDPYIAPHVFQKHSVKPITKLEELIPQVDVLTLHVPLNRETKNMITPELLDLLKPTALVINAARGGLYKESELLKRLQSGHIRGAGIDTFETEPKPLTDLVAFEKVYCTPHIGASTEEAQIAIGQTVYEQVVKAFEGHVVDHPVNLPEIGIITDPLLKVYAVLSEKLGALVGQSIHFNPSLVKLNYRGDLAGTNHNLIRLSFLKGFLTQVSNEHVSFVNAEQLREKMGLRFEEKEDPTFHNYKSALKIVVEGGNNESFAVGGVVFDKEYMRLSLINDFYFEVEPSGTLVLVENEDKPGVVGDLGQFLAMNGINIDSFELSRNRKGGKAMAVIKIDSDLDNDQVRLMQKIRNVSRVSVIHL